MGSAESLDDLIESAGLSLDQVATRARMSLRALFDLRAGRVASPRGSTLLCLARALRLPEARVAAALAESRRRAGA